MILVDEGSEGRTSVFIESGAADRLCSHVKINVVSIYSLISFIGTTMSYKMCI